MRRSVESSCAVLRIAAAQGKMLCAEYSALAALLVRWRLVVSVPVNSDRPHRLLASTLSWSMIEIEYGARIQTPHRIALRRRSRQTRHPETRAHECKRTIASHSAGGVVKHGNPETGARIQTPHRTSQAAGRHGFCGRRSCTAATQKPRRHLNQAQTTQIHRRALFEHGHRAHDKAQAAPMRATNYRKRHPANAPNTASPKRAEHGSPKHRKRHPANAPTPRAPNTASAPSPTRRAREHQTPQMPHRTPQAAHESKRRIASHSAGGVVKHGIRKRVRTNANAPSHRTPQAESSNTAIRKRVHESKRRIALRKPRAGMGSVAGAVAQPQRRSHAGT